MSQERVLVVPSKSFSDHAIGHGFHRVSSVGLGPLTAIFSPLNVYLMPKSLHETDREFRALVAYVLVEHDGWYFFYARTKDGDPRLAGWTSIGIGGHVNKGDYSLSPSDVLAAASNGAAREVGEEIAFPDDPDVDPVESSLTFEGLLLDNETDVGLVHVGMVYRLKVDRMDLDIKPGSGCKESRWSSPTMLGVDRQHYEPWSRILIEQLILPEAGKG